MGIADESDRQEEAITWSIAGDREGGAVSW